MIIFIRDYGTVRKETAVPESDIFLLFTQDTLLHLQAYVLALCSYCLAQKFFTYSLCLSEIVNCIIEIPQSAKLTEGLSCTKFSFGRNC